jgi:hypothetical protein
MRPTIIIIDEHINLVPGSRWLTQKGIIFRQDWSPNLPVGCNWPPSITSGERVLHSLGASDGKKDKKYNTFGNNYPGGSHYSGGRHHSTGAHPPA